MVPALKSAQVDLLNDQIVLRPGTTKNDQARILPIYGDMKRWLEMLLLEHNENYPDCPWVFQRDGKPIRTFRKTWAEACERAGRPTLRFHDLRRSAVRNMVRAEMRSQTSHADIRA
jgi:integrase